MSNEPESNAIRASVAGLLAWLVPGLGHLYLGHRGRGMILLVTITATFWTGVAIGGVRATVDPQERKLWFAAQIGTGGNTIVALALHRRVEQSLRPEETSDYVAHWLSADVGVHYTGIAGLLNLLVILDAIVRADRSLGDRRGREKPAETIP